MTVIKDFQPSRIGRAVLMASLVSSLPVVATAQSFTFTTPTRPAQSEAVPAKPASAPAEAKPAAQTGTGTGTASEASSPAKKPAAATSLAPATPAKSGAARSGSEAAQANALRKRLEAEIQSGRKAVAVLQTGRAGSIDSIDDLVKLALQRNPSLQGQQQALQAGVEQFREAAANGSPTVGLSARVSVAEGGRTFTIPSGDALNPVYRNLEALNQRNGIQAPPYPTLQNQTLSLLRPQEQDTRLVLTAPLYAPTLEPRVRAAGAAAVAASAQVESVARHLVRDVKVAWHGVQQALAQKQVFESSESLLAENLRVHEVLLEEGKVTRDAVLRAQSELLAVQQAVAEAQYQADNAARRLNVLTARPLDTEVRVPLESIATLATADAVLASATGMSDFQLPPELRQVFAGVEARKSLEEAARKSFRPTVGLAVEAGYQGPNYSTGPGTGVAIASVVMNWKFSDGGLRDAQVGAAAAARRQIELQEEDAKAQLEGILRATGERLVLSHQQVRNARARQIAAEEAFRIATLKRDAGALSQLEYFDSQRVLTDARSASVTAQAQLNVAVAEFELAKSSYPLAPQWMQIKPESLKK